MPLLYGMHDEEGVAVLNPDCWCLGLIELSRHPVHHAYDHEFHWLIRANWGYGTTGTIPLPGQDQEYLNNLSDFASTCQGATRYIIANEPNHEQEWPDGKYISPAQYASLFIRAYSTLKKVAPNIQVITAGIAPYKEGWLSYLSEVLGRIQQAGVTPDGIALHAYLRSSDPNEVSNNPPVATDGPLKGTYWGFRTYRDALKMVPPAFKHLPTYITETNELLPEGWHNANTGVVKAVYEDVNNWNAAVNSQKVHCVCLYRYPHKDLWYIEGKNGVVQDFSEAVSKGYRSPTTSTAQQNRVLLPDIEKSELVVASTPFQRDLDMRAVKRGVRVTDNPAAKWRVKKVEWMDEQQAGGRRNIFIRAEDENGNPLPNIPFTINWPNGSAEVKTKDGVQYLEYNGDFPLSPSRNEFSIRVNDGNSESETVQGIGMGQDTPSGFNPGIHTSTGVVFQRVGSQSGATVPDDSGNGSASPKLLRPVDGPISERFGEDPDYYGNISDSGVPLKGHNGIDYAVPIGTPVKAADAGTVAEVGEMPLGYGKYVKLLHSWGETVYAHLSEQDVQVGQAVGKGQVLGKSGSTGLSTGPHLHFAMRKNPYNRADGWGGFSDPTPYFSDEVSKPPVSRGSVIEEIKSAAKEFGVDWRLLASIAWAESSFNPNVNPKGLFQFELPTWEEVNQKIGQVGASRSDIKASSRAAGYYVKQLLNMYNDNPYKAALAYNWGMGNVSSGAEVPPIRKEYANKVVHGKDLLGALGI